MRGSASEWSPGPGASKQALELRCVIDLRECFQMVTQDGCFQMATRIEVRYGCEGVLPNGHPEGVLPNGHSGLLPPA